MEFYPVSFNSKYFFRNLVIIFFSNATCVVDDDENVIAIKSFLVGKEINFDVKSFCKLLGLVDTGLTNESTLGHGPLGSVKVLDAQDRILHLMITWWFRPSGGKFSTIRQVDDFWLRCFRERRRPNLG